MDQFLPARLGRAPSQNERSLWRRPSHAACTGSSLASDPLERRPMTLFSGISMPARRVAAVLLSSIYRPNNAQRPPANVPIAQPWCATGQTTACVSGRVDGIFSWPAAAFAARSAVGQRARTAPIGWRIKAIDRLVEMARDRHDVSLPPVEQRHCLPARDLRLQRFPNRWPATCRASASASCGNRHSGWHTAIARAWGRVRSAHGPAQRSAHRQPQLRIATNKAWASKKSPILWPRHHHAPRFAVVGRAPRPERPGPLARARGADRKQSSRVEIAVAWVNWLQRRGRRARFWRGARHRVDSRYRPPPDHPIAPARIRFIKHAVHRLDQRDNRLTSQATRRPSA